MITYGNIHTLRYGHLQNPKAISTVSIGENEEEESKGEEEGKRTSSLRHSHTDIRINQHLSSTWHNRILRSIQVVAGSKRAAPRRQACLVTQLLDQKRWLCFEDLGMPPQETGVTGTEVVHFGLATRSQYKQGQ